jgi:hypothetical protein
MAPATAKRYQYSALQHPDSIRILELLPGQSGSLLRCRLIELVAGDHVSYEALSYTWNGNVLDHALLIENSTSKSMVKITRNLHNALQALRKPDQPLRLWVDAVCIDQSDSVDKSCQVPRMGHIFRDAVRVIIWLGAESRENLKSVDALSRVASGSGTLSFEGAIKDLLDHLVTHFTNLPW